MNIKLEVMWMEGVMALFQVHPWHFPRGTEEKCIKNQSG
jgi:hypothetical protein